MRQTDVNAAITPFDKAATYKSKIEPLIQELVKQCTVHNIPMFVTCCVKNTPDGAEYKNQCVPPDAYGLNLSDDNIQKHLCIQLGFDTIYRSEEEFDFEEEGTKVQKG